jgi:signal transduction histidine kinase
MGRPRSSRSDVIPARSARSRRSTVAVADRFQARTSVLLEAFAGQATRKRASSAVLEDRERIAKELRDGVI